MTLANFNFIRFPVVRCLVLFMYALSFSSVVKGAISVGASGTGNINFDTLPEATEWSTASRGSFNGDILFPLFLDAAVMSNSAVTITNKLVVDTETPPAKNALAVWSTNGFLQTRPTQNSYTLLMATFVNNSGAAAAVVNIRYDFVYFTTNYVPEEVPGHRAYYSQTGIPGSLDLDFKPHGDFFGQSLAGQRFSRESMEQRCKTLSSLGR